MSDAGTDFVNILASWHILVYLICLAPKWSIFENKMCTVLAIYLATYKQELFKYIVGSQIEIFMVCTYNIHPLLSFFLFLKLKIHCSIPMLPSVPEGTRILGWPTSPILIPAPIWMWVSGMTHCSVLLLTYTNSEKASHFPLFCCCFASKWETFSCYCTCL